MRNLPNSYHFIQHNGNNILRWCFRRTLIIYLFFTNISLFLSETGTEAAEDIRKKEDHGYDELNAAQLRRAATRRSWQEKGNEKQDEQGSDLLQPELNINPKLSNGLRYLTRKKPHLSSDDQYGDSSGSDSNNCDVCPTDGPFRKRKYHFYILHDVTNVGLYDFFGGSSNSKEMESSIPVASFPITPVTSMPVIPLPLATLPPATSFPLSAPIPGTTLAPTISITGTTAAPATLPPITPVPATVASATPIPGTTAAPATLPPITPVPATAAPATAAPLTAAPVVRLASTATIERSSVTEGSPATGKSSFWQRISDFLSRFY